MRNPGPYENVVDEGAAEECADKITKAVQWATEFRASLDKHKTDATWLLQQLIAAQFESRGFRSAQRDRRDALQSTERHRRR